MNEYILISERGFIYSEYLQLKNKKSYTFKGIKYMDHTHYRLNKTDIHRSGKWNHTKNNKHWNLVTI